MPTDRQITSKIFRAKKLLLVFCFASACVLFAPSANAQTNPEINYQGKLTDSSGAAVSDGTYNMRFWLLQSTGQATSSAVWTESRTGGDRVQVTNGLFSVMLGDVSSLAGVDFNQTLYLGVEIGGAGASPSWDGEMSPRKILGTVPAAFEARKLGGVASSSFLRSDQADTASGLLTFTGGLLANSSSTITDLTSVTATTTNFVINGERFTDLTGTGLENSGNTLRVATTSLGLGDGTFLGLSDTPNSYTANALLYASSTGSELTNATSIHTDGRVLSLSSSLITDNVLTVSNTGAATLSDRLGSTTASITDNFFVSEGSNDRSGHTVEVYGVYTANASAGSVSGSSLDVQRDSRGVLSGGDVTVTGALSSFTDTCTTISGGTCTSSADVMQLSQEVVENTGTTLNITSASTNGGYVFRANDDGTLTDTSPFLIDSAGDTMIGTTTSRGLLTVDGDLFVGTSSLATLFTDVSTGRVGIGTTTPSTELDIEGTMRLKEYSTTTVPAAGSIAGKLSYLANGLYGTPTFAITDGNGLWQTINPERRTAISDEFHVLFAAASGAKGFFVSQESSSDIGEETFIDTFNVSFPQAAVDLVDGSTGGSAASIFTKTSNYWYNNITGENGPAYEQMQAAASTTPKVNAIVWGGETDLFAIPDGKVTRQQNYRAQREIVTRMHEEFDAPVFLIGLNAASSTAVTDYAGQAYREVQKQLAKDLDFVYFGTESYDLTTIPDGHPTDDAYETMGQRLARKIANYYGANLAGVDGPQITSATRSGTTVTVEIAHDGGTDFTPSSDIDGFVFHDDGTEIAITSAVRTDADTITLTLNATPSSGTETLYYVYSIGEDANLTNYVKDNATPSMPLQTAVIDVAGSVDDVVDDTLVAANSGKNIVFQNYLTELARLTSGGDFLLGTTTATTTSGASRFLSISGTSTALVLDSTDGTSGGAIEAWGNQSLRFVTNGTEQLRIDGSGNVGIGTTTSRGLLTVDGDLFVGTSSLPALFADTSTNRVGIGTTTPAYDLTVAGDTWLNGALYDSVNNSAGVAGYVLQSTSNGTKWVATSSLGISGGADTNNYGPTLIVAASNATNTDRAHYVADGTDDEETIQNAINALPTSGGTVELTEGLFNVGTDTYTTSVITLDSNVRIMGQGTSTVLRLNDNAGDSIAILDAESKTNVSIKDLNLQGNQAEQTNSVHFGIRFFNTNWSLVDNVIANDFARDGVLVTGADAHHNRIQNSTANDNNSDGFQISSSDSNTISQNIADGNNSAGFNMTSGDSNTFTGNVASNNGARGFYMSGSSDNTYAQNTAKGNGSSGGFEIDSSSNYNTFTGNTANDNAGSGFDSDLSDYNTITGNTIRGNNQRGIYLSRGAYNTVSSNSLYGNGDSGVYASVFISGDSDENIITSNTISATSSDPLIEIGTATGERNIIANNTYENSELDDSTFVSDSGINTRFDDYNRTTLTTQTGVGYNLFNIYGSSTLALASTTQLGTGAIEEWGNSSGNVMTLNNSGNLLLGTSTSRGLLTVDGDLFVGTSSIPTLFADVSTGNVGIGTTTPSAKLYVTGGAADKTTGIFDGGDTDKIPLLITGSSTITKFSIANTAPSATTNTTKFGLEQLTTTQSRTLFEFQTEWEDNTDATRTSRTEFVTANSGSFATTMTLLDGNVGIGTTTPESVLSLEQNQNASTDLRVYNYDTGTAAAAAFRAYNDLGAQLAISMTGSNYNNYTNKGVITTTALSDGMVLGTVGADPVDFATNLTTRMQIDGSGNVNVGTTTSRGLLTVDGDFFVGDTSTPTLFADVSTGNVGIGSSTPGYDLTVNNQIAVRNPNGNASLLLTGGAATTNFISNSTTTNLLSIAGGTGFADGSNFIVYGEDAATGAGDILLRYGSQNKDISTADVHFQYQSSGSTFTTVAKLTSTDIQLVPEGSGNVGIGDTGPDSLLEVSASGGVSDLFMLSSDDANDGDRFIVKNDGKVGIGTSSPNHRLHIEDDISTVDSLKTLVRNTSSGSLALSMYALGNDTKKEAGGLWLNGSGNTGGLGAGNDMNLINTITGANLNFGTEQSVDMTIDSSGNVGIGTTTPQEKLHVYGSGTQLFEVESSDSSNASLKLTNTLGSYGWVVGNAADTFHLYDFTDSETRLSVDGDGNMGIGTSTPSRLLTVDGDAWLNGALYDSVNNSAGTDGMVLQTTGGGFEWVATSTLGISGGGGSSLFTDGGSTTYLTSLSDSLAVGTDTANAKLSVAQSADGSGLSIAGFDDQSGNSGQLSVDGSGIFNVAAVGSLGLGQLVSNGTAVAAWNSSTFVIADNKELSFGDGSDYSWGYNQSDDSLRLVDGNNVATDSNARLTVLNSGNVGVGTTTPDHMLSVAGDFFVGTSSLSTLFADVSTSRVGIGTTTPTNRLSVTETVDSPQVRVSYDGSRYATFQVDSAGDLNVAASGGNTFFNDDNVFICTGGSCPGGDPTGTGNLFIENKLGLGTTTPEAPLDIWSGAGNKIAQFFENGVDMLVGALTFDSAPASDHSASGNIVSDIAASTTVAIGESVYLNSAGAWDLANASASTTVSQLMGVAIEAGSNGTDIEVATDGAYVRDDSWDWTTGGTVYASTSAGVMTQTAPSGSGNVVRVIGVATSPDVIKLEYGSIIVLN